MKKIIALAILLSTGVACKAQVLDTLLSDTTFKEIEISTDSTTVVITETVVTVENLEQRIEKLAADSAMTAGFILSFQQRQAKLNEDLIFLRASKPKEEDGGK